MTAIPNEAFVRISFIATFRTGKPIFSEKMASKTEKVITTFPTSAAVRGRYCALG